MRTIQAQYRALFDAFLAKWCHDVCKNQKNIKKARAIEDELVAILYDLVTSSSCDALGAGWSPVENSKIVTRVASLRFFVRVFYRF